MTVNRDTYPFVKAQNSFLISTNDGEEFMFETKTTEERNSFLFAMKLMVARLASKIIVGDVYVFDEFFSSSITTMKTYENMMIGAEIIDEPNDDSSLVSGAVNPICNTLVLPIHDECDRTQELWGCSS
jgi:hypothetical protein